MGKFDWPLIFLSSEVGHDLMASLGTRFRLPYGLDKPAPQCFSELTNFQQQVNLQANGYTVEFVNFDQNSLCKDTVNIILTSEKQNTNKLKLD